MKEKSLGDQLRASDAVQSLDEEQRIAYRLGALGWRVAHGSYYEDPETSKLRELDIHAQLTLREQPPRRLVNLNLIVEVKTMRGFHIVIANNHSSIAQFCNRAWLGNHVDDLLEAASASGLPRDKMSDLSVSAERAMADEDCGSPIAALCIEPHAAPFVGSAFRETNIGSTKELDNSVLWRGTQAVFGAIDSLKNSVIRGDVNDLARGASIAATYHPEIETLVRSALAARMRHLHVYHPVVVTNARLWKCERDDITEVPWSRWVRATPAGSVWCDIVSAEAAFEYFAELTSHYLARGAESSLNAETGAA